MQKTVVITGANRGIGLSFAKYYVANGYNVIATARKPDEAKEVKLLTLDVLDEESINGLGEELKNQPVHLLINNAGILHQDKFPTFESGKILAQFQVNALAPLLLVRSLYESLKAAGSSKVINITSAMGSIDDNRSGSYYGYRASKAALNMFTKSLSIDIDPSILVLGVHPGYIITDMTGHKGDMEPDEAVRRMAIVIDALNRDMHGKFWHRDNYAIPY